MMFKRGKKWTAGAVILFALMAIGLIVGIVMRPLDMLLPVIILGGIFLLYKYPPSFLGGQRRSAPKRSNVTQSRATAAKMKRERPRSKTVPFRVIEGGKDDDDLPKYH